MARRRDTAAASQRAGSSGRLAITYRRTSELKPNPRNPRRHDSRQLRMLAENMKRFGCVVPLLIDKNDMVLAGHGRAMAAPMAGLDEVPTIKIEHLTDAEAKALMIADNRLAELATWDDRLLGETLKELSELDLSFSLETTGFTVPEIDLRIEGLAAAAEKDPADDIPAAPDRPPVTKPGDLWALGRHRVLCGNALEMKSFDTLMNGGVAQLVFTDPPYNVRIDGHATGNGSIRHREFVMASGEMDEAEFVAFLSQAMSGLVRYSEPGSIHYICIDWRHQFELLTAARRHYFEILNMCVWVKNAAGMGSFYRSRHELIFVLKHGTAPHRNNVQLGKFGRNRTNVWEYPAIGDFARQGDEGRLLELHPTIKPVNLVADVMLDASARGDVVLDAFLGSGTTLIAAERVGRICYGMEIDPLYVDTAIRRWQRHTGDHAVHALTGVRFSDAEAEAGEPSHE